MKRGRARRPGAETVEPPDAWAIAVKLLAMRALSTEELRRRLVRRGYAAEQIAAVLARLTASRYLDDAEYARAWARARAHRHCLGPARLVRELRARGIPDAEISGALREAFADRDSREVAEAAASRKLATLRGLAPEVARRRLAAHLTRQGFGSEIILALCRKHFPGGVDLEGE